MSRTLAFALLLCALCARPIQASDLSLAFQTTVDTSRTALGAEGLSAAVILADGTVWRGASGTRDRNHAVDVLTLFEIGSVTKTYTAAVVLLLASEKRLSLDDPLSAWSIAVPNAGRITLRQALNHTSGLADAWDNPEFIPTLAFGGARRVAPQKVFEYAGDPVFAPGEGWNYSSDNYLALGLVIEAVCETSVVDVYRERLFEPLRLEHTFFEAEEQVGGERAHAFLDMNNDGTPEDFTAFMPNTAFITAAWTAGGMVATAGDAASWMRALVGGELLQQDTRLEMLTWVDRPDGNQHGLGVLRTTIGGVVVVGHRGNSAGYSCAVWHAPDAGVTVAVLTNKHGVLVTPVVESLLAVAVD